MRILKNSFPKCGLLWAMLLLISAAYQSTAQEIIAEDLIGQPRTSDGFGWAIDISKPGHRLVVGSKDGRLEGEGRTGAVRVYELKDGFWQLLDSTIYGELNSGLGYAVAMTEAGNSFVVGAPDANMGTKNQVGYVKVFDWNGHKLLQRGNSIPGMDRGIAFGASVDISADGTRIAAATGIDPTGYVIVQEYKDSAWMQLGEPIYGENLGDYSGYAIDLSDNGERIAISSYYNEGSIGRNYVGHVRVFDWDGVQWEQVGCDIDGQENFEAFGISVAFSSDGKRIAIGSLEYLVNISDGKGFVGIYELEDEDWKIVGSKIHGTTQNGGFGRSLDLSDDGQTIAVGIPFKAAGYVRIFHMMDESWSQSGEDIMWDDSTANFGLSVRLSSSGDTLVIGAPRDNQLRGLIRTLKLDVSTAIKEPLDPSPLLIPNPTSGEFHIQDSCPDDVKIFDLNGREVASYNRSICSYDISHVQPGIYFVNFVSKQIQYCYQVIKI